VRIASLLSPTALLTRLQHKQGNKEAEEDAHKEAEAKVKEIDAAGKKSGAKVVEDLLRVVTDVKPEVPDKVSVNS
jgi:V-type H+-transporting ATPase subunit G